MDKQIVLPPFLVVVEVLWGKAIKTSRKHLRDGKNSGQEKRNYARE